MKLILLAATAMLAVPAIAQDTTTGAAGTQTQTPSTTTPTTADPQQTADPATTPAPGTPATTTSGDMTTQSQTMPAPSTGSSTMGTTGDTGTTGTGSTAGTAPGGTAGTPMGGYQPSQPPMSGTAGPGVATTFQAAPSPSEAYPAPAPLAKYPICKKGQYDKCMQRGGR